MLCAGKAARALAVAASELLGPSVRAGLIIGPEAGPAPPLFESTAGSHPVPTADSERAGRRALEFAASIARDETLVVLLSGGASALMAVPSVGLTLEDKRVTTERLLRAGADIHALNTVRKHISGIKGGRLAARASGRCRTLAVSDVVGDDLSVIASGPTVPDASTFAEACAVLERFGGMARFPAAVVARLTAGARGEVPETPKPGDSGLTGAAAVIGGRFDAMAGAVAEASARGYHVIRIDAPVLGEARESSRAHWDRIAGLARSAERPLCVVSSGETTVRVTGAGKGGRNQEFALASADLLAASDEPAVVASVGTDGIDGPTDAAGAVVDSSSLKRARGAGLASPDRYLAENDAYEFFRTLGDLILTGPTNTNVGDLQVVLIG